jgi:alpha-ketoglutarate-dependent sulfate ester dioxygenase
MPATLTATTHVEITRLAGQIGAEITGADTGTPLNDEVIARIRQSLLDHKVVFLRDQSLNYRRQVAFAERLGPLTLGHPTLASPPGQPLLEEIDSLKGGKANYWHTDVTFVDRPPAFTLLHAVVIPPVGGDTQWANTEHPLVRVHPETSERSLVLGGFARTVLGFTPQASRDLIRVLQDYITRPEHTVRWRWRQGDLAIWDNRATQHYAIADYGTAHRRGERVTVAGPVPVGVDGRPSVAAKGDASAYYAGGRNH